MSGPAELGFVSSWAPTANRSAGSSVHGCTKTAPRRPCAGPTRPTATSSGSLIDLASSGRRTHTPRRRSALSPGPRTLALTYLRCSLAHSHLDQMIRDATRRSGPVDVDHVDTNALPADAGDNLAEGLGCPPIAANDPTEIVGMYPHLQPGPAPVVHHVDRDIVRMVDDAAYEVLE